MKPWYVYIVECSDGTLYTGITTDVMKRVGAHNGAKGARYTRGRAPVGLLWSKCLLTKSLALKEECRIKKLSRAEKFELIDS